MTGDMQMWLNLLIHVLPLIPTLVKDVEGAVQSFKNDPNGDAKAKQAQQAVQDLGEIIGQVIKGMNA